MRVLTGKAVLFVLAGFGLWSRGRADPRQPLFIQPTGIFSVEYTALMIFMVLVGGLGTFDGPDHRRDRALRHPAEFGDNGVWYFVLLGAVAIAFALFLPRGLMGTLQQRLDLRLMPVGYRLRLRDSRRSGEE